jgi:hypothetical protein
MSSFDAVRVRDTAASLLAEHKLPGLSVGVVSRGDLIFSESFGLADIESATPMTPEHRQRIASITKTMVALCAMALVDEDRLSLEDRVAELLPDIPFKRPVRDARSPSPPDTAPGVYEAPSPGPLTNFRVIVGLGRVQLSNRDGALVLHARRGDWKGGVRLVPLGPAHPDAFVLDVDDDPEPTRVALARDATGNVVGLHFGGGDIWYMQRTDAVQPWA